MTIGFFLQPKASLNFLAQVAADLGVPLTRAALQARFTPKTRQFVKACFEQALTTFATSHRLDTACLGQFPQIFTLDSTHISFPPALSKLFPSPGSCDRSLRAGLRFQVFWELTNQRLHSLSEFPAKMPDVSFNFAPHKDNLNLPTGSLLLLDRGYFKLASFRTLCEAGVFFITRHNPKVLLYTPQRKLISLTTLLAQFETLRSHQSAAGQPLTQSVELDLLVGEQTKLPLRLIIEAIPCGAIAQRHKRTRQLAAKKQVKFSAQHLARMDYQLFLTNLPAATLTREQISLTYRLRWQIELYFKVWKSGLSLGFLAGGRGKKPERVLIEVYVKLLGLLMLGNLAMAALAQTEPVPAATKCQSRSSKPTFSLATKTPPAAASKLALQAQHLDEPSLYKLIFVVRRHILKLGQLLLSHPAAVPCGYTIESWWGSGTGLGKSSLAGQTYGELFGRFMGQLLTDCRRYGLKEKRHSRPTSFLALHLSTAST